MRILGIDPGSRVTGYGVIKCSLNRIAYVDGGTIRTEGGDLGERLHKIFEELDIVIKELKPEVAAVERVFVSMNVRSALLLGHARGSAICACTANKVELREYSAREVKKCITGSGAADKTQIQYMVQSLLALQSVPQADEADALACAITHYQHMPILKLTEGVQQQGIPVGPLVKPA